ncbi:tRNA (guanosine(37)-N1)-methyltransferase TrmD [Candidatus Azambacteria bacterium RIFCSPHIGHO2_02_46_12]|uniref:tRNA (guanine-N(1)-)-methyltransferase n=1 Tax=Candidatus Azambacteria bacterium RIFCSPHIGHO2_02_46_12 TaxID=1797295 RepID=A0A1F5BH73_9BACT|nr:MAG: tRNA (guanosine(37)-N1)-methyltransferase TrmD [Candidatus Azambacteria bacterium RIFCSPHIGHO2_02_46_12]
MLQFDIITIFPKIFDSYFGESIIKRARKNKLIKINVHNLRIWAADKHKKVDDKPYGGGAGMVLKTEPLAKAMGSILKISGPSGHLAKRDKTKVLLFSAAGTQFTQKMAGDWAKKINRIVMIAGHYEGVDERIKKIIRDSGFPIQEISIGPYVLTGGELPAMIVADAISRHIKGVLGKEESLEEKRFGIGVPVYTRPNIFIWKNKKYAVPKVLLSGNHQKIAEWRVKHKK